jgi:L-lactate utilization protein LutC
MPMATSTQGQQWFSLVGRTPLTRHSLLKSGPTAPSDIKLERVEGGHEPHRLHATIVKGLSTPNAKDP